MNNEINNITETVQRIAKATTPPVDLREVEALCNELSAECKGLERACAN
jgi:hypothetical protein